MIEGDRTYRFNRLNAPDPCTPLRRLRITHLAVHRLRILHALLISLTSCAHAIL